ncbi:DUF4391 domain-containing protein [Pseudoalteromonas sp. SS15]|uniref:DUF4391 domain-containing protein n=1 Tax=Pseudoalteromonas sp. SS15 TaxID=3139393 RepID=UPI003BAB7C39
MHNTLLTNFISNFNFPSETKLGVKVPKKTLTDNTDLTSADKAIVKDVLKSIDWAYTLKPETINIPTYNDGVREYLEIAILLVRVKSLSKTKQLCKLLHSVIPYPTMLLVEFEESLALSTADKRINQADSHKLTIENQFDSGWITPPTDDIQTKFLAHFSLMSCSTVSLYDLYVDFINRFNRLESAKFTGTYDENQRLHDSFEVTNILYQLTALENELGVLRNKIRQESLMNNRVELNMRSRKIKLEMSKLKNLLIENKLKCYDSGE